MAFLAEQPPVTHPTHNILPGICPDGNVLCGYNGDSLVSSAIAILVTLSLIHI